MKRILCLLVPYALLAVILTALFLIGASLVGASPEESGVWVFEVDDKVVKGNEGDVIPVATFDTPSQIIGQSCLVTVVGDNAGLPSPHPNNDIVMTSDTSSVEVKDFERHEYQETEATERLTLGATIDVAIRLGPDKKSSGGATIRLHDCQFFAFLPIVNGPSLPRGDVVYNTTVYCEEGFVQGFAWTKNMSTAYWVDVDIQFSGWGFASARLLPGEEHTFEIEPNVTSVPAGTLYISLNWENGEAQSFEVPFEALDCNPADWVVVHMERDPWYWVGHFSWESVPMWFQPPADELSLISIPLGRQEVLRVHGHLVEYDVADWYGQQFVTAVYIDGVEIETVTGEVAEVVIKDENGVDILAVFVGEGCGTNECQNPMVWWRYTNEAEGLLVDIANEW